MAIARTAPALMPPARGSPKRRGTPTSSCSRRRSRRSGPSGMEIDAVARGVIEHAGQGEHFGHGLGHGVGMEVHEGPRLSRTAGEEPLRAGNVVTVEPGVYLPGRLGVRIEDLVVVEEGGAESLSALPK